MTLSGVLVVAEVSANHNGSLAKAREIVAAAAQAGAHAIKFQTYTAATMTLDIDSPEFAVGPDHPLWAGRSLYSLYEEAATPWEWHEELFALARSLGIVPFSSPFDQSAVDFLESLDAPMYKIASMEIVDLPLIDAVARTGKPVVISTGTASLVEIDDAVATVLAAGNLDLTLLVCTSAYPASPSDANLLRMRTLQERFGLSVGLSDHSLGLGVSIAAAALGASMIERHFILSRADGGPDSAFSMEPAEFAQLVAEVRSAEVFLGTSDWVTIPAEAESRRLRRSLYVVEDVSAGELVSRTNVRAIRPSYGMPPKHWWALEGTRFVVDVSRGTPLSSDMVDGPGDS